MLGIINLNKPTGKTSHDMVSFVRKTLGIRRVGHAGTLDPEASGVLPILVGKATALSELLTDKTKSYTAGVQLGVETDTYDATGTVTGTSPVRPTAEEIQKGAKGFIGTIEQVPPMYSAIKKDGKKLYDLARQGITIERKPRRIEIFDISCFDFQEDGFSMEVSCSKGTYIRSLCHDLGKALGTCACMASLVRSRSGPFSLAEAVTPEELAEAVETGRINEVLLPPETVLSDYLAVDVPPEMAQRVKNGLRYRVGQLGLNAKEGERFRLYEGDNLLCLAKAVPSNEGLVLAIEVSFY